MFLIHKGETCKCHREKTETKGEVPYRVFLSSLPGKIPEVETSPLGTVGKNSVLGLLGSTLFSPRVLSKIMSEYTRNIYHNALTFDNYLNKK